MTMKIKLLGAALAGVLSMGVAGDVLAGPGDLAAIIIAAGVQSGETTQIVDGPNGFQEVIFFNSAGEEVSRIESGTPNVGSSSAVSGSINASYGAVADSGVEAFVSGLGFDFGIPEPEPRQRQFVVDAAAKKLCDDEIAEIEAEIEEFEKRIDDSERKLAQIIGDVERLERISLREIIEESRESASSIQVPTDSGIRAIRLAIESELDGNNSTGQIDFPGVKGKIADRFRKNSSDRRVLEVLLPIQEGKLREAKARLAEAKKKCDDLITPASNYVSANLQTSGGITVNEALITAFGDGGSGTVGGGVINGVAGNFSVANPKATRPWAIFLNSGITGLDDDRTGADRRARIFNVAAGAKILWDPKTTLGFTGGYQSGKVTSNANASRLTGDYFSATLSADYLLRKALTLGLSATYARGDNTLEIGGGEGDFNVDVFAASASLSDTFVQDGYVIAPRFSAGISQVQRDGYTDSLGVIVPGSDITSGNVSFGTSISKTFTNIDKFSSITPSISLTGSYFFREDLDSALTSGTIAEELGLGANLATGIDMQFNDGMGINIGGSYGRFEDNIEIWSLTAKLIKKF